MPNNFKGYPVILYKKDGNKEVQIALFRNMTEAKEWSTSHGIMSNGWVRESLNINDYPTLKYSSKKFPNANNYRFSFARMKEYSEKLYTVVKEPTTKIVIFKDGEFYGEYKSLLEAVRDLEPKIGGNLRTGIWAMAKKGWVPSERSQLYGFSAKLK